MSITCQRHIIKALTEALTTNCHYILFVPLSYYFFSVLAFGSTLLAPKTSEQLQLLEDLLINQTDALPAWVGLDNLAVKRQFRWVDDGSLLCLEQEENMFLQGIDSILFFGEFVILYVYDRTKTNIILSLRNR